ncbi:NAD-dependent epimerase/dehydratase family protein [Sandaracinobacteroides sp. A072]|uniref:NAD-dependent epimerase/dehydratase family protein n=1 Tax=Sandaracinobacteroides sp. A072 TaxID=3461146 RepID=UPI004043543D
MALTLAITGGTGFVGGHTLEQAVARGHRVKALARRAQPPRDGVEWVAGDLADQDALDRLTRGADAVIHIAGVTNAPDRAGFLAGNVQGTASLRAASGDRPFVHVSSLSAREPRLSAYGASKLQSEHVARGAGGPVAIVRPPAVYGPGDMEFLALFRAARTGFVPIPARARASMIFGPDLAEALVALAEDLAGTASSAGQSYEIDDGAGGHAQPDIARAMARALGVNARPVELPGGLIRLGAALDTGVSRMLGRQPKLSFDRAGYFAHPDWTADSSALRALDIWHPATGLAEGMALTAGWYRAKGLLEGRP